MTSSVATMKPKFLPKPLVLVLVIGSVLQLIIVRGSPSFFANSYHAVPAFWRRPGQSCFTNNHLLPPSFTRLKAHQNGLSSSSNRQPVSRKPGSVTGAKAKNDRTTKIKRPSLYVLASTPTSSNESDTYEKKSHPDPAIKISESEPLSDTKSTAIILNTNARAVTSDMVAVATEIFGAENVYATSTVDDAKMAAREVVRQKYKLVVPVGGDGTLSGWINGMVDEILSSKAEEHDKSRGIPIEETNGQSQKNMNIVEEAVRHLPMMGYIPMGTGNGLGYVIGCRIPRSKSLSRKKTSIFGSVLRRQQRRLDRVREVMMRLKEVGDDIQKTEVGGINDGEDSITDILSQKCTITEMSLMEVTHHSKDEEQRNNRKGDLCFFAGAGFDSLMLHDFQQLKAWSSSSRHVPSPIKNALSSVAGYCVALVTKTLPQTLRYGTHNIHVVVTTPDEESLWIDHRRGDFAELAVQSGKRGEEGNKHHETAILNGGATNTTETKHCQHLLYSGTTGILSASTAPFYGGGMKLFPHASLFRDKLQLRLGRISPLIGFINIPKIFEGSYREKSEGSFGCLDFIGDDFEVEVSSDRYVKYLNRKNSDGKRTWFQRWQGLNNHQERTGEKMSATSRTGFPFQHSGESMGCKERFRLRVVKEHVKFVSFLEPRVITSK